MSIISIEYIPEKYIYTRATVGGITTGGISKVGGYDEVNKFKIARRDLLYCAIDEKITFLSVRGITFSGGNLSTHNTLL